MSVVPLAEAHDEATFGGKAVQLGASVRAGLPVPPGVALSAPLVDAVAAGDPSGVAALIAVTDLVGGPVAVRSSAIGEDSAEASFAGQHLTQLNVRDPRRLSEAVSAVWASARSEAALAYRQRLGIDGVPRTGSSSSSCSTRMSPESSSPETRSTEPTSAWWKQAGGSANRSSRAA